MTGEKCCGYEADGKAQTDENYGGWDCLIIPGAAKATANAAFINDSQCGQNIGLITQDGAAAGANKTVCCEYLASNLMTWPKNVLFLFFF